MTDPDTLPEGGTLDLPSPRSPRELDEKILRYAREQAPEPERRGLPVWVTGLAAASIAGVALLLVQPQWPEDSSPGVDLDQTGAEMAGAARVLEPRAAAPKTVVGQAARAPSPAMAAGSEENAAPVAEMLAADSMAAEETDTAAVAAESPTARAAAIANTGVRFQEQTMASGMTLSSPGEPPSRTGSTAERGAGAADAAMQLAANEDEVMTDSNDAVQTDRLSREETIEFRKMHGRQLPESVPPASTPVVGEVPQDILDRLRADLAQRTGSGSEPTVIRAESRVWPNGALGCPKPGINYTQALVEGYHVVFLLEGRQWDYRTDRRGYFVLCEKVFTPPG